MARPRRKIVFWKRLTGVDCIHWKAKKEMSVNVLNRANFGIPNATVFTSAAGVPQATAGQSKNNNDKLPPVSVRYEAGVLAESSRIHEWRVSRCHKSTQ